MDQCLVTVITIYDWYTPKFESIVSADKKIKPITVKQKIIVEETRALCKIMCNWVYSVSQMREFKQF